MLVKNSYNSSDKAVPCQTLICLFVCSFSCFFSCTPGCRWLSLGLHPFFLLEALKMCSRTVSITYIDPASVEDSVLPPCFAWSLLWPVENCISPPWLHLNRHLDYLVFGLDLVVYLAKSIIWQKMNQIVFSWGLAVLLTLYLIRHAFLVQCRGRVLPNWRIGKVRCVQGSRWSHFERMSTPTQQRILSCGLILRGGGWLIFMAYSLCTIRSRLVFSWHLWHTGLLESTELQEVG